MNKLSTSQRNLLTELLKYLEADDPVINDNIDNYLITVIRVILNVNTYTDDEKLLLNGLRELYLKTIEQTDDGGVDDEEPTTSVGGVDMW